MIKYGFAWNPNPPEEQIGEYAILLDGVEQPTRIPNTGSGPLEGSVDVDGPAGVHQIAVQPIGPYGPGPASDPISSAAPATKPTGLHFTSIQVVNVTTNVNIQAPPAPAAQ